MKKILGILFAAGLLANVASAQEVVIQPISTALTPNNDSYLDFDPQWIDGSGFTNGLESIIETGDPIPAEWPGHITGYNATRVERIRNADEFETLTFALGGVFELTGMVLWNSTESGQTERGFENTVLSYSTDGGATFTVGETLTWTERSDAESGNLGNDPVNPTTYAPEVQTLATSVPGVTHVRMVVDNFSVAGANNIILASEIRFTGLPAPEAYYVATTPTDWTDAAAWSDGNPASAGTQYFATNSVVLETPGTTATFPGEFLTLGSPQRMELMVTGSDVITIAPLRLEGGDIAAGVVDSGEAKLDGEIIALSGFSILGATNGTTRDLRILSEINSVFGVPMQLSAPGQTIYIDNTNNTVAGIWSVNEDTTVEFADDGAIGLGSIVVQSNGTLRINGDWDGLSTGEYLTIVDSTNTLVDLGTYSWTVNALQVGSSNVLTGFTYDADDLNAIASNATFTGTGTIQIGNPYIPPLPPQLIAHWPLDEGTGTTTTDASGNGWDGTLVNGALWGSDGTRDSYVSFDGTDDRVITDFMVDITSASKDFTWAVWVNMQEAPSGAVIIGNRYPNFSSGYNFWKLTSRAVNAGYSGTLNHLDFDDMAQNEWHHHAVVKSGSNLQYYIDGVASSNIVLTQFMEGEIPFFMGGDPDGNRASEHAKVLIDDVALYNFALATSNVVDVMNGIYDFVEVDLSNAITAYSFNPSGTSSLSFTGAVSSAYLIKSTGNLVSGGFTTITPTAVTVGSLAGDVITTDGTGAATAEFTETAPAQFYQVESAP